MIFDCLPNAVFAAVLSARLFQLVSSYVIDSRGSDSACQCGAASSR